MLECKRFLMWAILVFILFVLNAMILMFVLFVVVCYSAAHLLECNDYQRWNAFLNIVQLVRHFRVLTFRKHSQFCLQLDIFCDKSKTQRHGHGIFNFYIFPFPISYTLNTQQSLKILSQWTLIHFFIGEEYPNANTSVNHQWTFRAPHEILEFLLISLISFQKVIFSCVFSVSYGATLLIRIFFRFSLKWFFLYRNGLLSNQSKSAYFAWKTFFDTKSH